MNKTNDSDFSKLDINVVQYIVYIPFDETYYTYSINSLDSQHLIDRNNVLDMIRHFSTESLSRASYLSHRFLPFIYVVNSKEILELEKSIEEEDIKQLIFDSSNLDDESTTNSLVITDIKNKFNNIFELK